MPKRKKSVRRQEYEAAHPTVTARIPAEVRERLLAALQAENLNFSEWVQARVAGSVAQATAAYRRGRTEGHKEGTAAGYQQGRAEGEQVAGVAGFQASLLACAFAADHDRHYPRERAAERLAEHPERRAIAERLIPEAYKKNWQRLIRATERVDRGSPLRRPPGPTMLAPHNRVGVVYAFVGQG